MKLNNIVLILLLKAFVSLEATAQKMDLSSFTPTLPNLEPESYSYDFYAPVHSELLCRNGRQKSESSTTIIDPAETGTYFSNTGGSIDYSGMVVDSNRVHLLSDTRITLSPGFEATSGSLFSAEIVDTDAITDYCPFVYNPAYSNRYFISVFGPRMKTSKEKVSELFDFHQGTDIVDKKYPKPEDGDVLPFIHCMCDGEVTDILDGSDVEMEAIGEGRSVTIKCDEQFAGNTWGSIYLTSRHLSQIGTPQQPIDLNDRVKKGQIIGVMGETGLTSNNHLHLSVQREVCYTSGACELVNVHPDRVFNSTYNSDLIEPISTEAEIHLLDYNNGIHTATKPNCIPVSGEEDGQWALIRVAIPYNQVSLRAVTIRVEGTNYTKTYDYEEISANKVLNSPLNEHLYNTATSTAEDYDYVKDLKLFVFPFYRANSAYHFFNPEKTNNIVDSLASKPFHTGQAPCFPIENNGIFSQEAYVFDILSNNMPAGFGANDIVVEVVDIWGNGIKGQFPTSALTMPDTPTGNSFSVEQINLEVYPNPTQGGLLNLHFQGKQYAEQANCTLYNPLGQAQRQVVVDFRDGQLHQMNLSGLPAGLYLLKAEIREQVLTQQVIVQ